MGKLPVFLGFLEGGIDVLSHVIGVLGTYKMP